MSRQSICSAKHLPRAFQIKYLKWRKILFLLPHTLLFVTEPVLSSNYCIHIKHKMGYATFLSVGVHSPSLVNTNSMWMKWNNEMKIVFVQRLKSHTFSRKWWQSEQFMQFSLKTAHDGALPGHQHRLVFCSLPPFLLSDQVRPADWQPLCHTAKPIQSAFY